jgi:hypothetical protein
MLFEARPEKCQVLSDRPNDILQESQKYRGVFESKQLTKMLSELRMCGRPIKMWFTGGRVTLPVASYCASVISTVLWPTPVSAETV